MTTVREAQSLLIWKVAVGYEPGPIPGQGKEMEMEAGESLAIYLLIKAFILLLVFKISSATAEGGDSTHFKSSH